MVMTSVKYHPAGNPNLRPVDVIRDMPTILNLIEIGFHDELDPQGWKMLSQMRKITNQANLLRLRNVLHSESGGFVWVEDGSVVANLSLRLAVPSMTQGRLIGNVVVHPEYRGLGIGHELVAAALRKARQEGARWIGLEVRQQNEVACDLYQSFGFRVVGSIFHMLRSTELPWSQDTTLYMPWRKSKPIDKKYWMALADSTHGHYQKRVLEIRDYQFTYGSLDRKLNLWLNAQHESAWIHDDAVPRCAVCVKTDRRYRFHVWDVFLRAGESVAGAREAVARALSVSKRFPHWATITLVADQEPLVAALEEVGFHLHRTLLQMVLEL